MWTNYVLQILVAALALFQLAKDWGAHKSTWRRTTVGLFIVLLMAFSVYNTYRNSKSTTAQHADDQKRITQLQASVDAANTAQADNTKQFLQLFSNLSDKVAKLQTAAATEDLKKQAESLQAELQSTQKALNPPKATLEFSFAPIADVPVRRVALNRDVSGDLIVRFTVVNLSNAIALDGFIDLQICDQCSFVTKPASFKKEPGQKDTELNYYFDRIMPQQALADFEFKMHLSPPFANAQIGVNYRCKTCVVPGVTNHSLPDSLRGTIDIVSAGGRP